MPADPHPWPGHDHGALETCIDCGGPMFLCHTLETGFHLPGWAGCQLFERRTAMMQPARARDSVQPVT